MFERMRFHSLMFLALPLGMLTAGCAQLPAPEPREIEVADYRAYLTEDHPVRQGLRRFAENVETQSQGTLKVRVRHDVVPGTPLAQLEQFRQGSDRTPQLMLFAGTGLVSQHPDVGYLDLPFVWRDAQHADAQLSGQCGQALLDGIRGKGMVGLALWENGFRHVTNSTAPLVAVQDMSGMKFRVAPEAVFEETFKAVGAQTQQLPFSSLRRALADKSIEAQDNFLSQIWVSKLYEVQPYLSLTNHSYGVLVMAANEAFWKSLSSRQQSMIKRAATDAGYFQRDVARSSDKQVLDSLKSRGVQVNEMPAEELSKWIAATDGLRKKFWNSRSTELLEKCQ